MSPSWQRPNYFQPRRVAEQRTRSVAFRVFRRKQLDVVLESDYEHVPIPQTIVLSHLHVLRRLDPHVDQVLVRSCLDHVLVVHSEVLRKEGATFHWTTRSLALSVSNRAFWVTSTEIVFWLIFLTTPFCVTPRASNSTLSPTRNDCACSI